METNKSFRSSFEKKGIFFVSLSIIGLFIFGACKKKEEPEPEPAKVCDAGYFGDGTNCSTFNSAYATNHGTLTTENCSASGAAGPYTVNIVPNSSNPLQFNLIGLWEVPNAATSCTINSTNRSLFSAVRQPIMTGFEIAIPSGTLSANGASVTLSYQIYATSATVVSDACTSTIVR